MRVFVQFILVLALFNFSVACHNPAQANTQSTPKKAVKVLVLGDSLSAEYGLRRGTGWVNLLASSLGDTNNGRVTFVNASISGETTAGGRQRLSALLKDHQPQIVLIELGGNDALRGLALSSTEDNLRTLIQQSQQAKAEVILIGTKIPPNYGKAYSESYFQLFSKLQKNLKIAVVPFLLAGFADQANYADYFQTDGIHPNEAAQKQMADNVRPFLLKQLAKIK